MTVLNFSDTLGGRKTSFSSPGHDDSGLGSTAASDMSSIRSSPKKIIDDGNDYNDDGDDDDGEQLSTRNGEKSC